MVICDCCNVYIDTDYDADCFVLSEKETVLCEGCRDEVETN